MNNINRVFAEVNMMRNSIVLHFFRKEDTGGRYSVISNVEFTTVDPSVMVDFNQGIQISNETAQELMDSLWRCGVRPADGNGNVGALKATEDHVATLKEVSRAVISLLTKQLRDIP